MKIPCLLASLAVAATASASPQDPAEVLRTWTETTFESAPAQTADLSLRAQVAAPPSPAPVGPVFGSNCWPSPKPIPRAPIIDAPSYRVPRNLPNDRPRGAIPWDYDGQVYWLVPLAPPAGK